MKRHRRFPRIWYRYVDDVFAVVKERHFQQILELINGQHETMKFTVEKEENGKLPFLDLCVSRTDENTLQFSIYRKPTHTDRYITSDSYHCGAHKQAAFHSMAHRLYSIPMTKQAFNDEKKYIIEVARINGYSRKFIDKIFNKHQQPTQQNFFDSH